MKSLSSTVGLVLTAFLLVAPGAHTEEDHLSEAKRLYLAAEFESAIARLQPIVETLERRTKDERHALADAYLYLGLSYSGLGEEEKGREAFRNLLGLDPERTLDPHTYAPKVLGLFEQARASMPPPPGATPRPAEPRYGLAFGLHSSSLGDRRLRPHEHLPFARDFAQSPFAQPQYQPIFPLLRCSGYVTVGGGQTQVRVDYTRARTSVGRTETFDVIDLERNHREGHEYRSEYDGELTTFDVRLAKVWKSSGALVLRRELGYRYRSADQQIDESIHSRVGTVSPPATREPTAAFNAESGVRTHGVRLGLEADILLSRRFNLDVRVGLTQTVAGSDRGQELYSIDGGPMALRTGPDRRRVGRSRDWDVDLRLRFNMGRGLYLTSGYRLESGPSVYGPGFGNDLSTRGGDVSIGWRFGSSGGGKHSK